MPDVIHRGELILDEETGEILEWPSDVGPSRIDFLQDQYREAADEEKAWELRKQGIGRALAQQLVDACVTSFNGKKWRSTYVAPKDAEVIYQNTVTLLVAAKVINEEQADELRDRTALFLDKLSLEAADAMVVAETMTKEQRDLLISRQPRTAYVRTSKLTKPEPKRARKMLSEYEEAE